MKSLTITLTAFLVCGAAFHNPATAQNESFIAYHSIGATPDAGILFSTYGSPIKGAMPIAAAEVSSKVLKSFNRSFKPSAEPTWSLIGKRMYVAEFDLNGRKSHALFANNGFMEYAVSYGKEASLPKGERRLIKSNYVDYNINSVVEVAADRKKAWVVHLQEGSNYVVARIVDGMLDELSSFSSQPQSKMRKGRIVIPHN